jgi:prepilin-type processing-associated H-X9-DG protein
MMYAQDYDERNLSLYYGGGPADATMPVNDGLGTSYSWRTAVQPYLKNWQIHLCPSSSLDPSTRNDAGWRPVKMGYGFNMTRYGDGRPDGLSLAAFQEPAGTLMLADGGSCGKPCFAAGCCGDVNAYDPNVEYWDGGSTERRHNEGANFAYYDGHVKWAKTTFYRQYTVRAD